MPKTHRPRINMQKVNMQVVAEAHKQNAEVLNLVYERNKNRMPFSVRTIRSCEAILRGFIEYVRTSDPEHAERPFNDTKVMLKLFHNYMIARVETGKGKRVHEETGAVSRISISTLWRLSYDLFFLAQSFAGKKSMSELEEIRTEMNSLVDSIRTMYKLSKSITQHKTLSILDCSALIETQLFNPNCWDIALQRSLLLCLFAFTGCRPGSLLPRNDSYPDHFIEVGDLELYRVGLPGSALFALNVILKWHKGYHGLNRLVVRYNMLPAQSIDNLHLDAPLLALLVLFRRGCFGERSLHDIIYGNDRVITVTELSMKSEPLFFNGRPRGLGQSSNVFTYKAASESWFPELLRRAGLDSKTTFYDFRFETAQRLFACVGETRARAILGHSFHGQVLENHYASISCGTDIVGHALQQDVVNDGNLRRMFNARPTMRLRNEDIHQHPDPTTIEDDDVLKALEHEMNLLAPFVDGRRNADLRSNKDAWRKSLPKSANDTPYDSVEDYYFSLQLSAMYRYKKVAKQVDKVRRTQLHVELVNTASIEAVDRGVQHSKTAGRRIFQSLLLGDDSVLDAEGIDKEDHADFRDLASTVSFQCIPPEAEADLGCPPNKDTVELIWKTRVEFLTLLSEKVDPTGPTPEELKCPLCCEDPYAKPENLKTFDCQADLDKHLRSMYVHTARQRIVNLLQSGYKTRGLLHVNYPCPYCPTDPKTKDSVKLKNWPRTDRLGHVLLGKHNYKTLDLLVDHVNDVHMREGESSIPEYDLGLLQAFEASGRGGKRERSKPLDAAQAFQVPKLRYSDIVEELVGRSGRLSVSDMVPDGLLGIGDTFVESATPYHATIDEALDSAFGGQSGFLSDVINHSA